MTLPEGISPRGHDQDCRSSGRLGGIVVSAGIHVLEQAESFLLGFARQLAKFSNRGQTGRGLEGISVFSANIASPFATCKVQNGYPSVLRSSDAQQSELTGLVFKVRSSARCGVMRCALADFVSIVMTALTTAHLSIAIDTGDPVDSQEFRHTSLFFRFQSQSPALQVHIVGTRGEFKFDSRADYDPVDSQALAKLVDVGALCAETSFDRLLLITGAVPIDNADREFNCQIWVENGLRVLRDRQLLTGEQYEHGHNGMVDAIAEAEDDG